MRRFFFAPESLSHATSSRDFRFVLSFNEFRSCCVKVRNGVSRLSAERLFYSLFRVVLVLRRNTLMSDERNDSAIYKVVVNHEDQYSIWPDYREIPAGWSSAGKTGTKSECLEHIKTVWTDMRPLSLRKRMDGTVNAQ